MADRFPGTIVPSDNSADEIKKAIYDLLKKLNDLGNDIADIKKRLEAHSI